MNSNVLVFDPTVSDQQSKVRGIGRYLQILKENFPEWTFTNDLTPLRPSGYEGQAMKQWNNGTIFLNPFFNFFQPPLTIKRLAQKQIVVIHDLIPLKYPDHFPAGIKGSINIALNKYALRNYDLVISDSEASKKDIINILGIHENKIKVVYPCLPKVFSMKYKVSSIKPENAQYKILNTRYCLYVGDATWNKNLVNLAKAIKIANVNCVFVGKIFGNWKLEIENFNHPWQKELKEFYGLIKDDKRFIFKGFISDEELIKLYQQATVNILPSRDEGFGFSYLEAASQGCPSILGDIPVLHEISGGNALFADPEKPDKIANGIGELFFNDTKRKQIGETAYKQSFFFSRDQFKKEFVKLMII